MFFPGSIAVSNCVLASLPFGRPEVSLLRPPVLDHLGGDAFPLVCCRCFYRANPCQAVDRGFLGITKPAAPLAADQAEKLGNRAYSSLDGQYDWTSLSVRIESLYEKMLHHGRA